MMESLSTSVTGLNAFSKEISVISNNVANSETTSYKSSDVSFSDILSECLSGTSGTSLGAGVLVSDVSESWSQGSISSTGNATDLAINGSGFFVVSDPSSGETYYTRDGEFSFDDDGTLVNSSGLAVQGYLVNENGGLGALDDIDVSYDASPASATSEISTTVNLNSETETDGTYESSVDIYDSLGNEHTVTITFAKTADNEWSYSVGSSEGTVGGDSTGTLSFSTSGALTSGSDDPVFTITGLAGADDMSITWDIADSSTDTSGNTTYLTNGTLTQYSRDSALYDSSQDGYSSGELSSISIDDSGMITGTYSNGTTSDLYQIALADFNDYNGLEKVDGGLYAATSKSGEAIVGIPGTSRFGSISSESLESSNVDLSTELANLITAQRAYQANAKVFSASDEILQTLIKL
jgi:flagellar hook protein FlgE